MFFSETETARFGQDIWWLPLAGGWDFSQIRGRQKISDLCWNCRIKPRHVFTLETPYHWFQSEMEETIRDSMILMQQISSSGALLTGPGRGNIGAEEVRELAIPESRFHIPSIIGTAFMIFCYCLY